MTRPLGKFIYNLNNSGYVIGKVVSEVEIHKGDALCYNGNRLVVVSKDDDTIEVRKTGYIINVKKYED